MSGNRYRCTYSKLVENRVVYDASTAAMSGMCQVPLDMQRNKWGFGIERLCVRQQLDARSCCPRSRIVRWSPAWCWDRVACARPGACRWAPVPATPPGRRYRSLRSYPAAASAARLADAVVVILADAPRQSAHGLIRKGLVPCQRWCQPALAVPPRRLLGWWALPGRSGRLPRRHQAAQTPCCVTGAAG
jgi:hypothetical protein